MKLALFAKRFRSSAAKLVPRALKVIAATQAPQAHKV
jgi:hypothetical protein